MLWVVLRMKGIWCNERGVSVMVGGKVKIVRSSGVTVFARTRRFAHRRREARPRGGRTAEGLWAARRTFLSSSSIRHIPLANASRFKPPWPDGSHSFLEALVSKPDFVAVASLFFEHLPDISKFGTFELRALPYRRNNQPTQLLIRPNLLVHSLHSFIFLRIRYEVHR